MSRKNSHELTLLECFSVPEAGVYSVSVYEIQHGGTVGHKIWNLPQVIIGKNGTEESIAREGHHQKSLQSLTSELCNCTCDLLMI